MHKLPIASSLVMLALLAGSPPLQALTLLTEDNPPFSFPSRETGKGAAKAVAPAAVGGTATEIVQEMARRAGVPVSTRLLPWDDAYRQAQADKDTCLYSVARLENRENQLVWVGELVTNKWAVFGRPDFARPVKTVTDLRPLKIGGIVQDAKVEYLKSRAVTNIREVLRDEQNPPRLNLKPEDPGHIDLWITSYYSGNEIAERAKAGPVKMVLVLREQPLWLACSPRTDKAVVKQLADALATMNRDGTRKRILDELEKRVR